MPSGVPHLSIPLNLQEPKGNAWHFLGPHHVMKGTFTCKFLRGPCEENVSPSPGLQGSCPLHGLARGKGKALCSYYLSFIIPGKVCCTGRHRFTQEAK